MAGEENSSLIFLFSPMLCSTWGGGDLSSPIRNPHPLYWKHGILTTGLPGKSQKKLLLHFIDSCEKTATPGMGRNCLPDNENPVFLREVSTPPVMPAESSAFRIKSFRCSSSFVTDSLRPGPEKGNELAGLCENNKRLFFQDSWLRTHCPKCSGGQRSFQVPSSQGSKEQPSGLASTEQSPGVASMHRRCIHGHCHLDSLELLRP